MNAIKQFCETLEKNEFQRNSDLKLKGKELQYNFPHLDDDIVVDDDDYPQ